MTTKAQSSSDTQPVIPSGGVSGSSQSKSSSTDNLCVPGGYGGQIAIAFLAMLNNLKDLLEQYYESVKQFATLNLDVKTSFVGAMQNAEINSGIKQGDAQRDQALGYAISAGVGGACLLGSAGGFVYNRPTSAETEGLNGANAYKNTLNGDSDADLIAERPGDMEMGEMNSAMGAEEDAAGSLKLDEATRQRMKQLEKGVNIDSYRGMKDGAYVSESDEATATAAKHLSPDARTEALEKAEENIKTRQKAVDKWDAKQQTLTQTLDQINRAGGAAAQAGTGYQQAEDTTQSAADKAHGDVLNLVVQNNQKAQDSYDSSAKSSEEKMNQLTQQLTSALLAQAHGSGA